MAPSFFLNCGHTPSLINKSMNKYPQFEYNLVLVVTSVFSFVRGEISPNFDLKNMISTYKQRIFHGKNGQNLQNFEEIKFPGRQIFMISSNR